ncbi:unnamed protein product, partial [Amoebophrya sp. A120]
ATFSGVDHNAAPRKSSPALRNKALLGNRYDEIVGSRASTYTDIVDEGHVVVEHRRPPGHASTEEYT